VSGTVLTGAVTATAPAKINLCLGVGPARADGFHTLATVYQAVGLLDRVTVRRADDVTVTVRAAREAAPATVVGVPTDETNIAVRAALLLASHHGSTRGVAIHIDKAIPVAGGLAGGSADAAAALLACDALWGLHTPWEDLVALAGQLGSDVPFALVGGTAVGSGRGEVVTPLDCDGHFWWVVLASAVGLATPEVYRTFDTLTLGTPVLEPEVPGALLEALRAPDVEKLGAALENDLQPAALHLRPELRAALELGGPSVHGAMLSGSGPSCLFLCGSRADAVRLAAELERAGHGPVAVAPGPVPGARLLPDAGHGEA
jgi:4-diphosphocytidyl-2-C-methyl-D-erythritol kinase